MACPAGAYRRRQRLQRLELRIVGVVAMNTEQILFVTVPITGPLAMNPHLPVAELVSMALAAQPVRLGKINKISGDQPQLVPVDQVMAIRTPALPFGMMKHYLGMILGESSPERIRFKVFMALAAGEDPFGKRGAWHFKGFFLRPVFNVVGRLLIRSRPLRYNQLP